MMVLNLLAPSIVTGDGSSTDVYVVANFRIAQIGQMTGFRALTQTRFFHFHKVTYVSAFQQLSARAQTRKRADGTCRLKMGIFHHAVRADFAVVTDHAVF
ncbi:hypothetical protein HR12_29220 [Microbacterium sp. SUBG005]|nr:hypothetical protein HR12_29220 [Microbacterium sp. SUBG005]